jgi:cytochrome P450
MLGSKVRQSPAVSGIGRTIPAVPSTKVAATRRRPTSLTTRLANNAALLRLLARPLRRFVPVLSIGRVVVVTRHADVVDVLERDEDFTIAEVNAATMDRIDGPFILGMDRSELFTRERAILQGCVHPSDPERIRDFVTATAGELVAAAAARGRIDVVQDLARPAATRLVASYFGVPGPDEATMMGWMRILFWEAFMNSGGDLLVRRAGVRAAAELHMYVDELIAAERAGLDGGGHRPDTMLTRLIRAQADPATRLSDEGVRRNICGVIVGAVDTTSKATAQLVDQLLRHEGALRGAQQAARDGDMQVVAQYAFEALRFNPLNPVLVRHVARDAVIAEGTRHRRPVPSGHTVYAAVLPAMFDNRVFPDPETFRHDRLPAADLNFGHGMHSCFGRYVNQIQIPELVAALLRCDGLRRASGREGRMEYEGPFPDRLLVDVDAGPVTTGR